MKDVVELIAKALVDNPDDVSIEQKKDDRGLLVELRVLEEDMGRVIGKQGRTAKAIRTIVKAAGLKQGKHVWVDIDMKN